MSTVSSPALPSIVIVLKFRLVLAVEVADDEDRVAGQIGTVQSATIICGNVGRIDLDFLDIVEFGYDRGEVRAVPSDDDLGAGGEQGAIVAGERGPGRRGVDPEGFRTPVTPLST